MGDGEFIKRDLAESKLRARSAREKLKTGAAGGRGGGEKEGDEGGGWRKDNEDVVCPAANNGILLGEKFPACRWLGDPVKLQPPPAPAPTSRLLVFSNVPRPIPGVPVIFRNIAESRGGPLVELTGHGSAVNRFQMERKTCYTVEGAGNGRRSSGQAK